MADSTTHRVTVARKSERGIVTENTETSGTKSWTTIRVGPDGVVPGSERKREVICPTCGYIERSLTVCSICKSPVNLPDDDFQDVEWTGSDDGHHSWYSQPTAVHDRFRCLSYPRHCERCLHNTRSDTFCVSGRIDIRRERVVDADGSIRYVYKGRSERG